MGFYKKVGDSCICDLKEGQEVRYFIPEKWFTSSIAIDAGEFINLLGVFSYALFDANDKMIGKLKNFNFPTAFLCKPYQVDKVKEFKLSDHDDIDDYRILRFQKGDKLIVETKVPQMVENVEALFKLFVITGRIPPNIDYRDLYQYFLDNVDYSGNRFTGVPPQMLGIFVSKLCRDISDPSKEFRHSKEKKSGKWTDYKSISVKEVPKYTSAFASFTSEVFDDSVIAATQIKDNKFSPLERLLMGHSTESSDGAK